MVMVWLLLHPRMTPEALGFIPSFIDEDDPRPAKEQIDSNYQHGGGWRNQPGWELRKDKSIKYPGDPPLQPLATTTLRKELLLFYEYGYLLIMQPDGSFEIARLD